MFLAILLAKTYLKFRQYIHLLFTLQGRDSSQSEVKWKLLSRFWLFATPWTCRVHGILQARILEWVAFPFSRRSSQPRDRTQVSHTADRFFTSWASCPRILEWVAYPFSIRSSWPRNQTWVIPPQVKMKLLSCVWLFVTPWTVAQSLLHPWNFPGKSTGVGCHFLLQRIFPTQGLNPGLLHCKHMLLSFEPWGKSSSPRLLPNTQHLRLDRWVWQ